MTVQYQVNVLGDVFQTIDDAGNRRAVDPSAWGWLKSGGRNDPAELRRSVESLRNLPGFEVEKLDGHSFVPGTRTPRSAWLAWEDGSAPPAAVESDRGTRAYFNRLSEAAGHVGHKLANRARGEREPVMTIWDFVGGRCFDVTYSRPTEPAAGTGTVYVVDDGVAFKVGYTGGTVAVRIQDLQTGNPRRIMAVAEIANATEETEAALHAELNDLNVSGEWFDRGPLIDRITAAGSVKDWLATLPAVNPRHATVHPPYR